MTRLEVLAWAKVETSTSHTTENPRRRWPRGRRRRRKQDGGEEEVVIWSFNSSGALQLRAALEHAASSREGGPVAVLSQEHDACRGRMPDIQAQTRKQGWRFAAAEAVVTEAGGKFAGVRGCTLGHSTLGRRDG